METSMDRTDSGGGRRSRRMALADAASTLVTVAVPMAVGRTRHGPGRTPNAAPGIAPRRGPCGRRPR